MAMNQYEREAVNELNQQALDNKSKMFHLESNINGGLKVLQQQSDYVMKNLDKDSKPLDPYELLRYIDCIRAALSKIYPG